MTRKTVFFPLLILFAYGLGILATSFLKTVFSFQTVFFIGFAYLLGLLILWILKKKYRFNNIFKYLCLCFFATGFFVLGVIQTQKNRVLQRDFQSKLHPIENTLRVIIKKTPPLKKYTIADVLSVNGFKSPVGVLLYPTDTLQKWSVGDVLLIKTKRIYRIKSAMNPHQFDGQEYFFHQKIFARIFATTAFKTAEKSYALLRYRDIIKQKIKTAFEKTAFHSDVKNLFYALILGDKSGLSKKQMTDYANAGVIHILAISGLHVGILLWIFSGLFYFLRYFKGGRNLQYIAVAVSLWGYAFLVGGSPSVVRAVTLFSVFLVGRFMGVQKHFLRQLAIAALLVLIIDPHQIFQLGFQMSYAAVFMIVWLQPTLEKIWQPPSKTVRYFWQLATVSIAAQAGVLPLSLYYFHQIPLLFLLSNLFILPLITSWVASGMFLLGVGLLGISLDFLSPFYNSLINYMQRFISWVAAQKNFLITDIYLTKWDFCLLVLLIGFCGSAFVYRKMVYLYIGIFIGVLMSGLHFYHFAYPLKKESFVVFHHYKYTLIAHQKNHKIFMYTQNKTATQHIYKPHFLSQPPCRIFFKPLTSVYTPFQKPFIIANAHTHLLEGVKAPIVLLTQNIRINLERLITALNPAKIIIDGTNKYYHINKWKNTCEQYQIPYHITAQKGAFIF